MIQRPELFNPDHRIADFRCGDPALDEWLLTKALPNQWSPYSRTYVAAERQSNRVLGYYMLSMGLVMLSGVPESISEIFGDPMRVMVLSRVVVHEDHQQGATEAGLVKDAIHQVSQMKESVRVRVLIANPHCQEQRERFIQFGFVPLPHDPLAVMLVL